MVIYNVRCGDWEDNIGGSFVKIFKIMMDRFVLR